MKFEEALRLLKEGKKVRRKEWKKKDEYLYIGHLGVDYICESTSGPLGYSPTIPDLDANDWEEYIEIKPLILLTKEEKWFLSSAIEMSPYRLDRLVLKHNYNNNENYLVFVSHVEEFPYGSIYVNDNYFKNLEIDRVYSIEELGLDEA